MKYFLTDPLYIFYGITGIGMLNLILYVLYRLHTKQHPERAEKILQTARGIGWLIYAGFFWIFLAPVVVGISRNGFGQLAQYLPLVLMIAVFGASAVAYGMMLSLHKAQNLGISQSTQTPLGTAFFGMIFFGKNLDKSLAHSHKFRIYAIRGLVLLQLLIIPTILIAIYINNN